MDVATFRAVFPEFGNADAYPDARLAFALREASLRLLPAVWGDLLDNSIGYYAAHRLALASRLVKDANGQTSASVLQATGLTTSKSVGSVSKSSDVSVGQTDGAGDLNLTVYGQQFAALATSVAVGAMQF